jgi:PAS domain S-box-containing protein
MADSLEQREEERKRAVEMLRTSEERFRALIEKAADVSALLTVEGTFTYVSPSVERVMGYTPDQVIGKSIAEWIHPEDLSQAMHALAERVQMGCGAPNPMHARVRHRDGRWRVLEAIGNNLLDLPAVRGIVLNCRDVTERIQAQHQVQQQLERLAALREVDRAITSSVDLRLTLDVVTQQVTAQLKVDAVSILLLDPHAHELKYAAGRGFRTKAIEQTRLRVGEEHAGRAALERRTVHIPNLPANVKQFLRGTLLTSENFIAYYGVPLIVKGQVNGVLEIFHRAPLDAEPEWLDFMEMLAGQAAVAIDNAGLFSGLQRANMDLTLAYEATIEGWSHALDLRDHETEGHTRRVTAMTLDLAQALGMSDERLIHVRHGALLHDIGKIGVPDAILLKPDALTDEEWQVMRLHPKIAYDLLASIAYLKPALDIPYCHHEKWDGSGYPRGLKGEQIPLAARVFAVVDAWDALTSNRPYRKAWSAGQAREYIAQNAGAHFDPRVAGMFLEMPIGGR